MRRIGLTLVLLAVAGSLGAQELAETSCTLCHGNPEWFDADGPALMESLAQDVHIGVGLSCHDCHGGNPDPALAEDLDSAMSESWAENPYRGAPTAVEVPGFCGGCHSDPSFMRGYRPDLRVDQEQEYRTSRHGLALARGDTAVATCIDCHGVHGIRSVADTEAGVYPTRVAETCNTCHGDPDLMAGRTTDDGRPFPVDPYARWRRSVHAASLLDRGDLSAPTCNDCHGNHGASPPGVESIAFVCGQCHGREAELFRKSAKHDDLQLHGEYVAEAGELGCAACHEEPEPQASFLRVHAFSECASCHGNHAVVRPTLAMLSPLPEIPCSFCHGEVSLGVGDAEEPKGSREHFEETRDRLVAEAAVLGLEGADRFDWLVDQAWSLPAHSARGRASSTSGPSEEFSTLFEKFRIGKTRFTYEDAEGSTVSESVVRCADCHAEEPVLAEEAQGLNASAVFLGRSRELMVATARAERTLLAARRGGVETGEALESLQRAVDAQIGLEVLVHTFDPRDDGPFLLRYEEGMEDAHSALDRGHEALGELQFRRKGLAVSLIFIALLLVALTLKIRQLGPPSQPVG